MNAHIGVSCDGCSITAFSGHRYKCLRCNDYDLCQHCYLSKQFGDQTRLEIMPHEESHPMQLMMTQSDFELVYEGDSTKNYENCKIASFTCPYCNMNGFGIRSFGIHVTTRHPDPPSYNVICPVCIATPDLETSSNRDTENLKTHWNDFHSASVDNNYRNEPIRGVVRRPMLARRAGRQQAGNRAALAGNAGITTAGAPVHLGFPWAVEGDLEVEDVLRNIRNLAPLPNLPNEFQRIGNQPPAAAREQLRTQILANQRLTATSLPGATVQIASNEYAQPRTTTVAGASAAQPTNSQVIRPLRMSAIYPPTNDMLEEISLEDIPLDDYTEDDGSDDGHLYQEASSAAEIKTGRKKLGKCVADKICVSDSEFELYLATDEDSSDEEEIDDQGHRIKPVGKPDLCPDKEATWKKIREKLTRDDVEVLLSSLRAEPSLGADGEELELRQLPFKAPQRHGVPADEGVQSWLSLQFDAPPIRSFGTETYWSDKRFLRQRRLLRDQSSVSSREEDLRRGEVALALITSGIEGLPSNLRYFDRPDRTLRRIFRNTNFETMSVPTPEETTEPDEACREVLMKEASLRFASERVSAAGPSGVDSKDDVVPLHSSTLSNEDDGESSENDDADDQ
ncbi:unnamed protein product [Caenorhabditis auriculariae]|uniref:RING-type E3 ubiquitin transferase n=1 Tax=Caenorhabditis auriculariae TaxID=2777116 RepID=A0A8S1GZL4_9PELO|nr:unnamed protein product [Caenorhabditis auriculariae]